MNSLLKISIFPFVCLIVIRPSVYSSKKNLSIHPSIHQPVPSSTHPFIPQLSIEFSFTVYCETLLSYESLWYVPNEKHSYMCVTHHNDLKRAKPIGLDSAF